MAYFEGEIPVVTTGGNGFGNGFGNGWEGLIGLALVAGLFDGGFGFGGGRGGYGFAPTPATQADLSAGFANSEIMSDLNDILLGQSTMQNFINQGFAGLNQTVTNGFAGVNNSICTLGYQNQAGFNALSRELADCCCATQRAIDAVNYNMAKNTCDIIQAGHNDTDRILGYLTNEKISALQAENSGLKAQISNDRQSAYIIGALSPKCPEPAYIVPNPNCCYNYGVYQTGNCGSIQ